MAFSIPWLLDFLFDRVFIEVSEVDGINKYQFPFKLNEREVY
jgi:hypothetical protein